MLFEMVKNNYKKLIALILLFAAFNLFISLIFLFLTHELFSDFINFIIVFFLIIHVFVRTTLVKSIYIMYSKTTTNINQLLFLTAKVIGGYALFILSAVILYAIFLFLPLLLPIIALMLVLSFITMVIAYYRIIADEPFFTSFIPKASLFIYIYFFLFEAIYNGISVFLLGNQEFVINPIVVIILSAFTVLKIVSDYYVLLR